MTTQSSTNGSSCDTCVNHGAATSTTELNAAVNRRRALKLAAAAAGTLGFGSLAQSALAASAQVKAGPASAVPVKGAKAYTLKGKYILVTQPKAGVFKAFSGICTHLGAQITSVTAAGLVCTVHGSVFDTTTGAVKGGPAPTGLSKYTVTNKAGTLYITV